MKILEIKKQAEWGGFHHDTDFINIEYIVTINEYRTNGGNHRCSKIRVKGAQDTWIQDVRTPEELAHEILIQSGYTLTKP
jgi:hypothetical protein